MIKRLMILIVFCLFYGTNTVSFAQEDCNPAIDICDDPDLPLDGGVGFLVAAGLGYGIRKIYKKKTSDQ